ncbi:MAG: YIP1 family protein [Pseudomonadota bacterium]|jgi:hypothetical protein|nr:YIP1 family protein [Pseudomonadota bacterium]MEC8294365.1 YIP1 family protein [Pseudomonadota bacterium]
MLPELKQLALDTLRDPKGAAPRVLALGLPQQVWWSILALVVVLNAMVYGLFLSFQPPIGILPQITNNPIGYALATGGMFAGLILLFDWIGRALGGQGNLATMLLVVTWLQSVQLIVLTVLSVLGLIVAGLASLLSLGFSLYFFWMLVVFLNEAHRFDSLGKSFALLLLGHLGAAFALSFLLLFAGIAPVGPV